MNAFTITAALGVACLLCGCATDAVQMRTFKIAGGESVQLPIARGGAKATENADLKIEVTGFMVDGTAKAVIYTFGFSTKKPGVPRSVRVEDVSGTEAEVLVADLATFRGTLLEG